MADHYGFTANPNYGYSQYSGQTHYGSYPASTLPYTAPPGPGNPATVEQISVRIRNMHPEEMAALADQWQNAWAFLADVRGFLVNQSNVLRDESWQSPAARDAFLKAGPGETLAYVDGRRPAERHRAAAPGQRLRRGPVRDGPAGERLSAGAGGGDRRQLPGEP
jgi:hypothetical protein